MKDPIEFTIEQVGHAIEVAGPFSPWLHYRLLAFPGCKFDKVRRVWTIARCRQHLVEIVIKCHLNNLSREDKAWHPVEEYVDD